MSRKFSVQRGPVRVVFGEGESRNIGTHVATENVNRVLVVATPGRSADATAIADQLGARGAGILPLAREHVPAESVAQARAEVERAKADALLAFGGGSAIGLAKAIALGGRARVFAIPTTYSGSEMTALYGISEGGEKRTGRDESVRPTLVVYDPDLTMRLPRETTIMSLWNAIAHAAEALWAGPEDRAASLVAEDALRLLASSLTRLAQTPDDAGARIDALEGSYLAGVALSDAGTSVHHKLCHILGGSFGLPHAKTHATLLPHVARFFQKKTPARMAPIARALGVSSAADGLARLSRATGVPAGLAALGMPRDGIERVTGAYMSSTKDTSIIDADEMRTLLEQAFAGAAKPAAAPRLRGPDAPRSMPGFGSTLESEALPGAVPHDQNTPRHSPYGLYPEMLSGTPFTVKRAENSKLWLYRVRPTFGHAVLDPRPSPLFAAPLLDVIPNRTRWKPMPIPTEAVDFLDGLVTLGGAGDPTMGPGFAVHLYAASADMIDRAFASHDGDLLVVPQEGTLEVRTELGWLRVPAGTIMIIPRGIKFAVGVPETGARGWVAEVYGQRFRLPERGPIGSNGLADERHFMAPVASFEDRECPDAFEIVLKIGGKLHTAKQGHSPFDVVGWYGSHVPFTYDLALFSAMGSVIFDHPDPSILTVLTSPLDDHGRAVCDFVVFPGRWEVMEHTFRPPVMHRNAASEINGVIRTPSPEHGYDPGCTYVSPLMTAHGVTAATYNDVFDKTDDEADPPARIPDDSLWMMFESALHFRGTRWATETPLIDPDFLKLFDGCRHRFDPKKR